MQRRPATSTIAVGIVLLALGVYTSASPPTEATPPDPQQELLQATQQAFRRVAGQVQPYLVRIHTVGGSQPRVAALSSPRDDEEDEQDDTPQPQRNAFRDTPGSSFVLADGATTGIVYSADGYIITSSFNFIREPSLISVTLPDGRRLAADLIARDQVRKIALLKVNASGLAVPRWSEVNDVRVGQWAVALGLGFGGEDPFVTVGIISALNRMQVDAVQTDAKLSPANYGGPLCDLSGRIVGICVPMAQRPGELAGVEMYDSGVGFALPKRRVDDIVATLVTGRSFYRGWLGIAVDPNSPDRVVVGRIANPSPMHAAGAEPGDVIVEAQGRPIQNFTHLMQALYMIPAGQQVDLKLVRDESELEVTVTLARSMELGPLPSVSEAEDPTNP